METQKETSNKIMEALFDDFVDDETKKETAVANSPICCCDSRDCGMLSGSDHFCSVTELQHSACCHQAEGDIEGFGSKVPCKRCSSDKKAAGLTTSFNESETYGQIDKVVELKSSLLSVKDLLAKLVFYQEGYEDIYFYKDNQFTIRHVKFALSHKAQTKLFVNQQLMLPKLYWYDDFHGMLTNEFAVLAPMALEDDKIFLSCWRTRSDTSPTFVGIFWDKRTDKIIMVKDNWKKLIINKRNDALDFDFDYIRGYVHYFM